MSLSSKTHRLGKEAGAKNSGPQMAKKPRGLGREDAHNLRSPIRSTCSLPPHLRASDSGLTFGWPARQRPGLSSGFPFEKRDIMRDLQPADPY